LWSTVRATEQNDGDTTKADYWIDTRVGSDTQKGETRGGGEKRGIEGDMKSENITKTRRPRVADSGLILDWPVKWC